MQRPVGRLKTTWLRTIDDDLQSTSGSTQLGGRQEIGVKAFGVKSSVWQHSTLEFANKEENKSLTGLRAEALI